MARPRNSVPSYLPHRQSGRARAVCTDRAAPGLPGARRAALPHRWHPNQLRHSYATKARKGFGLEHAGAALGHSEMKVTEVYAERDAGLALEVAAKMG